MHKNAALFGIVLAGMLLAAGLASADTYSLVDKKYLPLTTVYDTVRNENEPITGYSFEQLNQLMWTSPGFLRWNDGQRVCESMQVMFGKMSGRCANLPVHVIPSEPQRTYVAPVFSSGETATVQPLQPTPLPVTHAPITIPGLRTSGIVVVGPAYPPYGRIYSPYGAMPWAYWS